MPDHHAFIQAPPPRLASHRDLFDLRSFDARPVGPDAFPPRPQLGQTFLVASPEAHSQLAALGKPLIFGFALLAGVFAAASTLWFRRSKAGWILGVFLIGVNVVGDSVQLFSGRIFEGSLGLVLGGALFLYMLSSKIRGNFNRNP